MFDFGHKTSLIILFCIILAFAILVIPDLYSSGFFAPDYFFELHKNNADYNQRLSLLNNNKYPLTLYINESGSVTLLKISNFLFHTYRVLPFISSTSLLIIVYAFAYHVSSNRLGSLLAVFITMTSDIFFYYSIDLTYPNFWVLFLLLSLYPFSRFDKIKPVFFLISIFMKGLSFLYMPLNIYLILSNMKKYRKKHLVSYGMIFMIVIVMISYFNFIGLISLPHLHRLLDDYPRIFNLFTNNIIEIMILPVIVITFILGRKKIQYAYFFSFGMIYTLLIPFILESFTNYTFEQYHFIPFIVLFSISISLIIGNRNIVLKPIRRDKL